MSDPITTYNGRVILFNNGVVDVKQGDVSLVDSEKVAHIPFASVAIDNETIIKNANDQLEVPIDEDTIYVDEHGFLKAKQVEYSAGEHISIDSENTISAEWPTVSDHKVILCTKVGDEPAGPVGSFTLNQNSDKTITIPIPQPEVKEYTGGTDIEITSEGVINYVGGSGSVVVDNDTIIDSEGTIKVNEDKFIVKDYVPGTEVLVGGEATVSHNSDMHTITYSTNDPDSALVDQMFDYYADHLDTIGYADDLRISDLKGYFAFETHDAVLNNYERYISLDFSAPYVGVLPEGNISIIATGDGSAWTSLTITVSFEESSSVGSDCTLMLTYGSSGYCNFNVNPEGLPIDEYDSGYKWGVYYDGKGHFKVEEGEYGAPYATEEFVYNETGNLWSLFSGKQDALTAGTNITIENNVISATGGGTQLPSYTLDTVGKVLGVVADEDNFAYGYSKNFDSNGDSTLDSVDLSQLPQSPSSDDYDLTIKISDSNNSYTYMCNNDGTRITNDFGDFVINSDGSIHFDTFRDQSGIDVYAHYVHNPHLAWVDKN